jgi:hypothetical protein
LSWPEATLLKASWRFSVRPRVAMLSYFRRVGS